MGIVDMILFSINPAFDLLPATDDLNNYYVDEYDDKLAGIAPERIELYKLCEANNVGITVMKGYAGGRLFNKDYSPFKVALTPVQCLHYALTRPAVASIMVGMEFDWQVDQACHYEDATSEEKDYATVLANSPKHTYVGDCTYCGHCKPCPKNIDIAMVNKLYDLAQMYEKKDEEIPQSLKEHFNNLEANSFDCIECGGCETRCPFNVKIIEKMRSAKKLFK